MMGRLRSDYQTMALFVHCRTKFPHNIGIDCVERRANEVRLVYFLSPTEHGSDFRLHACELPPSQVD